MEQMVQRRESQTNLGKDMKRAAFRVFSALAATDEEIRKKIIGTVPNKMSIVAIFGINCYKHKFYHKKMVFFSDKFQPKSIFYIGSDLELNGCCDQKILLIIIKDFII